MKKKWQSLNKNSQESGEELLLSWNDCQWLMDVWQEAAMGWCKQEPRTERERHKKRWSQVRWSFKRTEGAEITLSRLFCWSSPKTVDLHQIWEENQQVIPHGLDKRNKSLHPIQICKFLLTGMQKSLGAYVTTRILMPLEIDFSRVNKSQRCVPRGANIDDQHRHWNEGCSTDVKNTCHWNCPIKKNRARPLGIVCDGSARHWESSRLAKRLHCWTLAYRCDKAIGSRCSKRCAIFCFMSFRVIGIGRFPQTLLKDGFGYPNSFHQIFQDKLWSNILRGPVFKNLSRFWTSSPTNINMMMGFLWFGWVLVTSNRRGMDTYG